MSAAQQLGPDRAELHRTLIGKYTSLVRVIVGGFQRKLPRNVLREDLMAAGMMGLWDAVSRHGHDAQTDKFDWYVRVRIRGAILDELRAQDWLPRRARANGTTARVFFLDEVSEFTSRDGVGGGWENHLSDPGEGPESSALRSGAVRAVGRALSALPDREQRVLRLHYQRGVKFLDIARELGVSEPRISQLHARAIHRMRALLGGETDEHRRGDRGAGDDSHEGAAARADAPAVSGRGLAGPPATGTHRPVPPGAGIPDLGRAPRTRLRGSRSAARHPRAAAPRDGGLAVNAAEAIPSVLPEEGLDLNEELRRYQFWLIDQALARANGNRTHAAKLLGIKRTTLCMILRPELQRPTEPEHTLTGISARIDWTLVASLRASGQSESQIAVRLGHHLGVNRFLVEKALSCPRPLAKCKP